MSRSSSISFKCNCLHSLNCSFFFRVMSSRVGQRFADRSSRAYQLVLQRGRNAYDRLRRSRLGVATADARVALGTTQLAELYRTNPREWNRLARSRLGATLEAMADNSPSTPTQQRPASRPSNYGPRSAGTGAQRPTQQRPASRPSNYGPRSAGTRAQRRMSTSKDRPK